jgi:pimeloyl-ACP methyl ester carboxylesterase
MKQIAVLIPGIMGSELRLDNEVIWPGPFRSLIFSYSLMPQLLDPDLEATDVIRWYSISKQYAAIIDDLHTCDFREDSSQPTLFVCPYDWRKTVASAATALSKLLDRIVAIYQTEEISITIIGHSMGGLVARYFLESGDYPGNSAFNKIKTLITLGTPHRGAPKALTAALGLEKPLFLSAAQARELSNDPRYPGLYHLLPPPGEPFAWNRAREAALGEINIYQPEVADALGLVRENLDAARSFHTKLNLAKRPSDVRYFFFVGTSHKTITHVALTRDGARYRVQKIETEDGGDGTVPAWSATLTGSQNQVVGGEHGTIYKNGDLRRTLAVLLGKAGVLAVEPDRVEVALRERVVSPSADVHVALSFSVGTDTVNGELRVERAEIDETGHLVGFVSTISSYPIRYSGLTAEKFSVMLQAPNSPGVYRTAYYPANSELPAGEDELFVQA